MTDPVDPIEIEWLRSDASFAEAADLNVAAAWGDDAVSTWIFSPLATRPDGLQEAERQLAWLKGPLVEDVHRVHGAGASLYLRWVEIEGGGLDYAEPLACFVVEFADEDDGTTTITVVRSL